MSHADKTFRLVIGARDNAGGMISNIAKRNATVIFKIEPASVDVVCVTLINAAVMETKVPLFKRYMKSLLRRLSLLFYCIFCVFMWRSFLYRVSQSPCYGPTMFSRNKFAALIKSQILSSSKASHWRWGHVAIQTQCYSSFCIANCLAAKSKYFFWRACIKSGICLRPTCLKGIQCIDCVVIENARG